MNFALTEEQEILRKSARDFLEAECPGTLVREMEADEAGLPAELWRKIAALGWMGLVFPEKYGGSGGSFTELAVVLEEMGRVCLPGPFFSTVVLGGRSILEAASEEQKQELLPRIARGDLKVALALTEPSASYAPDSVTVSARPSGKSYLINGTKLFVADAKVADYLVCVTRTKEGAGDGKGITLFLVDARSPGIECTLLKTMDGSQQCELSFSDVSVPADKMLGELHGGWRTVERVLTLARVAKCAEMVGGIYRVLEMSAQHAKERVQFGRPIGVNQAIQLHCANMAVDADIARFLTYKAAWSLSQGLDSTKAVAVAKAWVSQAYPRVTYLGQLVHGGIGFCLEHDIALHIRRAKAAEAVFGDVSFNRELVAREMGL